MKTNLKKKSNRNLIICMLMCILPICKCFCFCFHNKKNMAQMTDGWMNEWAKSWIVSSFFLCIHHHDFLSWCFIYFAIKILYSGQLSLMVYLFFCAESNFFSFVCFTFIIIIIIIIVPNETKTKTIISECLLL